MDLMSTRVSRESIRAEFRRIRKIHPTLHGNGPIGRYIMDFGLQLFSGVDILDQADRLLQLYLSENRGFIISIILGRRYGSIEESKVAIVTFDSKGRFKYRGQGETSAFAL